MSSPVTLCTIFAHPDDEAFGVSGTLARYGSEGLRTVLICATRGEAGMTNGLADSPDALAALRIGELSCAAQVMGLSELEIFDLVDGEGDSWDTEALSARIEDVLIRMRPQIVITFDSNGVTRHPDHVTIHRVTSELIQRKGPDLGTCRLFYQVVTCPEEASPEGPELACISPEDVDVSVDVGRFEAIKRAALRCHRTQAADTAQMLDLPEGSLAYEHYQLGWYGEGYELPDGADDLLAGLPTTELSEQA